MKITDLNSAVNSRQQFQVEADDADWFTIDAVDFFDFLVSAGIVDGHDPENGTAWVYVDEGYFDYGAGEWVGRERPRTAKYDHWLQDVDFNEVAKYLQTKIEPVSA